MKVYILPTNMIKYEIHDYNSRRDVCQNCKMLHSVIEVAILDILVRPRSRSGFMGKG